MILREEGIGYRLDVLWMFKGTKHRDEAEKLIDYIRSDKGMKPVANVRPMITKPGFEGKTSVKNLEDRFIDYDAAWAKEHETKS